MNEPQHLRTDAEIESAWTEATGCNIFPYPDEMLAFARAVLAEWGTPSPKTNQCGEVCERAKLCAICARELEDTTAPVGVEPVARFSALADELYARGYEDRQKERDYDPRGNDAWQAVTKVRKQDTALIRQLVDALEAMQAEAAARSCGLRICDAAITAGRARLEGKP